MANPNSFVLWEFFTKVPGKVKVANCNQCSKDLSYRTSITNLKTHLKIKHNEHYLKYISEKNSLCPNLPEETTSWAAQEVPLTELEPNQILSWTKPNIKTYSKIRRSQCADERIIDAMLLKFIAKTYQPVSMVEEVDFIDFVKALNPDYVLPRRKNISKTLIPTLYNKCQEDQKKIIKQEAKTVCLTMDCWTSEKMNNFIGITAHLINEDFEFKSVLLKCREVEDHTSQNLASIISETCTEWEISDRINMCVTVNTGNIIEATNILGWAHCGCVAHELNLVIQNSFGSLDPTLKKVKNIIVHFRSNYKAKEKLMYYQSKVQVSSKSLVLIDSEPTQWNSTFHMVERFVKLEDAVRATIPNLDVELPIITGTEWTALRQLSKVLKPFNEATLELSADKYVCASKAIPVINGLKDVLLELKRRPDYYEAIKNVVEGIELGLNSRFNEFEYKEYLALCTILDPRFKNSMFIADDACAQAKINLFGKVLKLIKGERDPIEGLTLKSEEPPTLSSDNGEICLWRLRNNIMEKSTINPTEDVHTLAQQEVDSYLFDELADSACDPCQWWRSRGQYKYPHLAKIFKTSCNIVATSVPSERLYSKAGHTLSERRTRLSVRKTEQLVFLNANLKNSDYKKHTP